VIHADQRAINQIVINLAAMQSNSRTKAVSRSRSPSVRKWKVFEKLALLIPVAVLHPRTEKNYFRHLNSWIPLLGVMVKARALDSISHKRFAELMGGISHWIAHSVKEARSGF